MRLPGNLWYSVPMPTVLVRMLPSMLVMPAAGVVCIFTAMILDGWRYAIGPAFTVGSFAGWSTVASMWGVIW